MFIRERFAALILSLGAMLSLGPQAVGRPYTVEDMLMNESIGKVRFDPAGRYLVFERHGPFADQPDFRRPHLAGQLRSRLFRVDLRPGARAEPLFEQRPTDSYSLLSISPDGSRLSFLRASAQGMTAGLYDVGPGRRRELRFPVGRAIAADARWVSNSSLVLPAAHPRNLPDFFSILGERQDQVVEQWQEARGGRNPTASQLGSGRFATDNRQEGALVLAEAGAPEVRTLAQGNFPMWFASPDGSSVAALKTSRLATRPDQRIEQGANLGGVQR
ncbi:hypothetical protein, partial [Allosphingosinicella sp.]|uniref:hypothetical protein n=1 Tax=Allosphingosinicella sp. TaxID=2823234 RepID=UPI002EFBCA0F